MVYTQILDNPQSFFDIKKEWNKLLSESGNNHFYLTHEFLFTWWKHLSPPSASLLIILVRDDEKLLAIAPFMIVSGRLLKLPVRKLEFIGTGWGYGGIIVCQNNIDCLRDIVALIEKMSNWDVINLDQTLNYLEISGLFLNNDCKYEKILSRIPMIRLDNTWEKYMASRPSSFRRNLKNRSRKLQQLGRTKFIRITSFKDAPVPYPTIVEWLRTIADNSWKRSAGTAISSNKNVLGFYSDLMKELDRSGYLDLCILLVEEKPVAYIYGALYNKNYYEIDIAFDERYSKVSPGVLLRNFLLQELFKEDLRSFDFVANYDYKNEWVSDYQDFYTHLIYKNKLYPMFLWYLRKKILTFVERKKKNTDRGMYR